MSRVGRTVGAMTEHSTPEQLAALYFDCWERADFTDLSDHLADDVTFDGPMANLAGRDACLAGLSGLAGATTSLTVRRRLADDTGVMTWFDLAVGTAEATPVVNWCECADGRIRRIRVTFDPRGILAAG